MNISPRIPSRNIEIRLRTGTRRGAVIQRVASVTVLTLFLSASLFATTAYPTAGPQEAGDDFNTSTVYQLSDVNTSTSGFYGWVADALSQLETSSGAFDFRFNLTDSVSAAIQAPTYEAWVVTSPAVTAAGGTTLTGRPANYPADNRVLERGGAAIVLTYTGVPGITINNPGWIQVFRGSRHGALEPPSIDNRSPKTSAAYVSNAQGTLAGGGVWLEDRPYTREDEYELNPVANEEFVSLLVGNDIVNGFDTVTIYGGVDWGYTYTAQDTPEPGSIWLVSAGISSLALCAFLRRKTIAIQA